MTAKWPVNRQNNHILTAVRMRLIYLFTVLICDYYGLDTDAANLSFHWLSTNYYCATLHHQKYCSISAICSSIHSSLDMLRSACHCSRSCTAYPWYLQCFVAKNLREPQLIIAAPPRWSKPRELFLPPVSPSSLCRICFTGNSAPLRRWSARKLDKTRWTR